MVEQIYTERIAPGFKSLSLPKFRSGVRIYCRQRWAKQGPPFPCVGPDPVQQDEATDSGTEIEFDDQP